MSFTQPPIEPELRTLRRLYRLINPITTPPPPNTRHDMVAMNLVPLEALTQKFSFALRHLISLHGSVRGDYLEFGVYNGASMTCMHRALKDSDIKGPRLIGFDSFSGLPDRVADEDNGVFRPGQFYCPRELTDERIRQAGISQDEVTFVAGWYSETLNDATIAEHGIKEASVVMMDCDAYSSAAPALEFLAPLIRTSTFIFFDDWRLNNLDLERKGEWLAFHEFRERHPEFSWKDFGEYNRKSKVLLATRTDTAAQTEAV